MSPPKGTGAYNPRVEGHMSFPGRGRGTVPTRIEGDASSRGDRGTLLPEFGGTNPPEFGGTHPPLGKEWGHNASHM